jgi:prepilin-type N-terminal cleavage/methylation domain-containing protein
LFQGHSLEAADQLKEEAMSGFALDVILAAALILTGETGIYVTVTAVLVFIFIRRDVVMNRRGFTLTELLVALAALGLVLAGLVGILSAGQRSFLVGSNQVESQQNVRVALVRVTEEIRTAGYGRVPPVQGPCVGVSWPAIADGQTATSFTLQNDWDGDGCINPAVATVLNGVSHGERTTYSLTGDRLVRQESAVDPAPVPIVGGVTSLSFVYLDGAGAVTAVAADIRSVVVTIQAGPETRKASTYEQGKVSVTMVDTARIRNR